jgi:Rab-like protein 2
VHTCNIPAWKQLGCAFTSAVLFQVFDITRKVTYTNLSKWYAELQENRPSIPCIVVANKIDRKIALHTFTFHKSEVMFVPVDLKATKKSFNFASKRQARFHNHYNFEKT